MSRRTWTEPPHLSRQRRDHLPQARAVLRADGRDLRRLAESPRAEEATTCRSRRSELVGRRARQAGPVLRRPDPDRVIFAANATDALNLAIQGIVQPGDHVVSTRLEHNSVLRPLYHLQRARRDRLRPRAVRRAGAGSTRTRSPAPLRPNTRAGRRRHASSVLGTVQPVAEIAAVCAERGVPLLVDAAQSAGQIPVDMTRGAARRRLHRSQGPAGTERHRRPGAVARTRGRVDPVRRHRHRFAQPGHTQSYPHRLEAGTLNLLGIIGLSLGLDHLEVQGIERDSTGARWRCVRAPARRSRAASRGRRPQPAAARRRPAGADLHRAGMAADDVGAILDADYGIAVRTGLHCAPLVHADLGTSKDGAVRFSLGISTTDRDRRGPRRDGGHRSITVAEALPGTRIWGRSRRGSANRLPCSARARAAATTPLLPLRAS